LGATTPNHNPKKKKKKRKRKEKKGRRIYLEEKRKTRDKSASTEKRREFCRPKKRKQKKTQERGREDAREKKIRPRRWGFLLRGPIRLERDRGAEPSNRGREKFERDEKKRNDRALKARRS